MSKRARITLAPDVEVQPNQDVDAILSGNGRVGTAQGPAAKTPETPASVSAPKRTLNTDTVIKVVLMGLAVVAAVLLFKGRKP